MKDGINKFAAILMLSALNQAGGISFAAEFEVLDRFSVDGYTVLRGSADIPGGSFTVGGSTLVVKAGNVGIGTASPTGKLQVTSWDGTNRLRVNTNQYAGIAKLELTGGSNADTEIGWELFHSHNNNSGSLNFQKITGGTGSPELVIKSNGNIGIGVTDPGAKLDIFTRANGSGPGLQLDALTRTPADIVFKMTGNAAGNEVVMLAGGSIGIGTTAPASALEVLTAGGGSGQLKLRTSQDVSSAGTVFLRLNDAAGSAGYIGFGGANNRMDIWNYKAGSILFGTSGASAMAIDSAGNVGIGTTDAAHKLEVNGLVGMKGRAGNYASGTVAADGAWHSIVLHLTGHNGFEVMADVGKSGMHALTHAICVCTYMGGGASGGITKSQAWYGASTYAIDVQWSGTTYDYDLQLRTLSDYGAGYNIAYNVSQLW